MKVTQLTLHNGQSILVDVDKFNHAMRTQDEDSGVEYSRVVMADNFQFDIEEDLEALAEKIND